MQFFLNLIEFCDIFRHYIFYSASFLETENILAEHLFHHRTFIWVELELEIILIPSSQNHQPALY